jgi:hypothetical protein
VPFEKSRATEFWLRIEQSILTAMEKSAEGIVDIGVGNKNAPKEAYIEGLNGSLLKGLNDRAAGRKTCEQ